MRRITVFISASIIVVAVILSVCVLLLVSFYSQQPLPTLSIDRVGNVTEVGKTFLVNVTLKDVPSTLGCSGWYLRLTWDPYIATLTTAWTHGPIPDEEYPVWIEGPFLKSAGSTIFITNYYDNDRGKAAVSSILTGSKNASGTGTILMMNFTVVHVGTTTIEFSSPIQSSNQSLVLDAVGHPLEHIEAVGLITEKAIAEPPSFLILIVSEIAVLLTATMLIVVALRRRSTGKQQ